MAKILDNIELLVTEKGKEFKCSRCGYELGPAVSGYRKRSLKVQRPLSYAQPAMLSPKTLKYLLQEYCCPKCGVLFEVELISKDATLKESIQLD
jgi:predicted RNA-binding Zn-ribbon protein involved in translation (DUF1610 family)